LEIGVSHIDEMIASKYAARTNFVLYENAEDLAPYFLIGCHVIHPCGVSNRRSYKLNTTTSDRMKLYPWSCAPTKLSHELQDVYPIPERASSDGGDQGEMHGAGLTPDINLFTCKSTATERILMAYRRFRGKADVHERTASTRRSSLTQSERTALAETLLAARTSDTLSQRGG
jgi:hypothetical protein